MKYLQSVFENFRRFRNGVKSATSLQRKRVLNYIDKNPFRSFFITLGILFVLIVISNILGGAKVEDKKPETPVKEVSVYTIGSAPKLTVQAQVEKSGVIRITALTPGVVQFINTDVGFGVLKGQTLLGLSSNYQGGNAFSLQRQLAETQYNNVVATYDIQKDIIKNQKEVAEKVDVSADELRSITDKSISETQSLIDLNDQILTAQDEYIAQQEALNNTDLVRAGKQIKSQFLAANNQAKQAIRLSEFNVSGDNPPAQISDLNREIVLKQLELQEKMLDVNREVSRIQLNIARVTEAMMFPSAPFNATVERISVKIGQAVNPGQELMILTAEIGSDPIVGIAYVSADIANKVSRLEESVLHISSRTTYKSFPSYVTNDAIKGTLYGIYYPIPDQYSGELTEKGFIQVDIPIGYFDTTAVVPYIPIDAVYQTQAESYVFLVKDGSARVQSVDLGDVYGSFVEVKKGLKGNDRVILDRSVIAADKIKVKP